MNFLGHVQVALATAEDPAFVLGAILPDVESLVGQTLGGAREDDRLLAGVALHKATDARFHADPRFVTGSIALTRALQTRGVRRGASRAVGHAGWELLLDGVLVGDRAVTEAFAAAARRLGALAAAAGADRLAWFAGRQASAPIWEGYGDPAVVAHRLHRQLGARPRLAFPLDELEPVTAGLAEAAEGVRRDGPGLVADIVAALARGA